jgi:hypothetical protein
MNNENQPIEKFLETASAGLAGDRELQLDVQAELRSHLEERLRDAEDAGLKGAAAESKALAMMGEPLELADKLATANRPRMRLRAWIRHTLRWALVPLAVLVAVLCAWQPVQNSIWAVATEFRYVIEHVLTPGYYAQPGFWKSWYEKDVRPVVPPTATPEQRLILQGLYERHGRFLCSYNMEPKTSPINAQILWEKWPTNQTYLHNFLSAFFFWCLDPINRQENSSNSGIDSKQESTSTGHSLADLESVVAKLRVYDPDNARFDYLLAGIMAKQAIRIKFIPSEDPKSFKSVTEIKDRTQLDRSMTYFKAALQKPVFRIHYGELERECLEILGKPTSIAESIQQVQLQASAPFADLIIIREFYSSAPLYGELLAQERRKEEAAIFLNGWKRLASHILASDINDFYKTYLVANAAGYGSECAKVYERLGDIENAARTKVEAEALLAPYNDWRKQYSNPKQRNVIFALNARYGVWGNDLLGVGLPDDQLQWCRHEEYLLVDTLMIGLISCLAIVIMLGCLMVTLWFKFWRKSVPLLLLPSLTEIAWVAIGGGLLPLLAYLGLTRLLPYAGREYSIAYAWPKFIASQIFLLVAIGWLTAALSSHFLRQRCRQLGVPISAKAHWGWLAIAGLLLVAQLAFFCIPDSGCLTGKASSLWPLSPAVGLLLLAIFKILCTIPPPRCWHWGWLVPFIGIIGLFLYFVYSSPTLYENWARDCQFVKLTILLMGLLVFVWLFLAIRYWRQKPESLPFYRGTLVRSLVPVLALSMLFLNLASAPWYRFEERHLVEQKTAILIPPENGRPPLEYRAAEKIRAEMQAVLEKLGK